MGWPLGAALQRAFVNPGSLQHGGGNGNVIGFAAMRCLRQGQFTLSVAECVGGTAFDQRQRLNRLDGGTRINCFIGIAGRKNRPPVSIVYRYRAAMTAFHSVAAHDFDEDRVGHSSPYFR